MSTKNLNTPDEYDAYLKELRITYHFECYKENNGEACHLLGDWFAQKKMMKEAIEQYKYACEKLKFPRSCYKYGVSLVDGGEVGCETDIQKAIHFTSLACQLGEPEGCWRNAQILQHEERFPEALEVHTKYCNMNHYFSHHSCYDAGVLHGLPEKISKIPQDFQKAFQSFSKGCALGSFRACYEVSAAYQDGRGVEQNRELAKEFRKKAQEIENLEQSNR